MNQINIDYLTVARIPTEKAHGHQILEMCRAFATSNNFTLTLNLPDRFNHISSSIEEWYGEFFSLKINKITVIDFYGAGIKSRLIQKINYFLIVMSYVLNVLIINRKLNKDGYYFIRESLLYILIILFKFFTRRKIIYEVHSLPEGKIKRYIFCFFLRRADLLIPLTPILNKILVSIYGIDENKILTLTDSISEKFLAPETHRNESDPLKICYIGRLSAKGVTKGVELILEAISILKPNRPVEFHLYGANEAAISKIFNLDKLSLSQCNVTVYIHGNLQYSMVPEVLLKHDILIAIYSKNDFHNRYCISPLKIFEYMGSGKLIIASDMPAFYKVLKNKINALLFKNNIPGIVSCLEDAINNFYLYKNLGPSARDEAFLNTWEFRVNKIYKHLIKNG